MASMKNFSVITTLAYFNGSLKKAEQHWLLVPKTKKVFVLFQKPYWAANADGCGLYYKRVTIVIDPPSVIKVTLQIVASLTIVIEDARLRLS
jgi:hypothetical protein